MENSVVASDIMATIVMLQLLTICLDKNSLRQYFYSINSGSQTEIFRTIHIMLVIITMVYIGLRMT